MKGMLLDPPPLATRVRRERRFRWIVEGMESGGLWVFLVARWTRWGAMRELRGIRTR